MTTGRRAVIAIGSNLGDREAHLRFAFDRLAHTPGIVLERMTAPEETPPLAAMDQPCYLNAMARVRTSLDPWALLAACHTIERAAGRDRGVKWASRTLDLDLVTMDDTLCDRPDLVVPHPGLRDRPFWWHHLARLDADA